MGMPAMLLWVASVLVVLAASPALARGQEDCRTDCPPRDDRAFLQSILDACPAGSICRLPEGEFTVSAPLELRKSLHIHAAGGGPRKRPGRHVTRISVVEGSRVPSFAIKGETARIDVSIRDVVLIGGGIHVGGPTDPCRGIDGPFSSEINVALLDLTIVADSLDAIRFEGTSLTVSNVEVGGGGNIEGTGLYVANATGDIVVIDAELVGHARWGVYVCNLAGTGQVFMNDVSVGQNGRGGIAIVGHGTPPTFRTVCMQNAGAAFNSRFGILLFDVARTLLFNTTAGFTFTEPDGRFGHGITVSGSDDVFLWDVTSALNEHAGFYAVGPSASQPSHVHLVGDIASLNNVNNAVVEGHAAFHPHGEPTAISGLCGFSAPIVAPKADLYCEQNLNPVNCSAVGVGIEPPDPSP